MTTPFPPKPLSQMTIKELARQLSPDALNCLAEIAMDSSEPATARVAAATAILDRALGRPVQEVITNAPEPAPPAPSPVISIEEFRRIAREVAREV